LGKVAQAAELHFSKHKTKMRVHNITDTRLQLVITYQKWKWIGHIVRQDNESIAKKALELNPQGGRRKGRPSIT
jgi:hypothetical protein